jgi:hypothetical protein
MEAVMKKNKCVVTKYDASGNVISVGELSPDRARGLTPEQWKATAEG